MLEILISPRICGLGHAGRIVDGSIWTVTYLQEEIRTTGPITCSTNKDPFYIQGADPGFEAEFTTDASSRETREKIHSEFCSAKTDLINAA